MTVQRLDRTLRAYRIGDPTGEYPIFDATGSTIYPGRWNGANTPVIYASEHYSTAMLEKLVHANGLMPPDQHFIEITLPRGLSYEVVTRDHLPDWATADCVAAREYGDRWAAEKRSAILLVPSFVARVENNVVINPEHAEFGQIETSLPYPVWWDQRLFSTAGAATPPKQPSDLTTVRRFPFKFSSAPLTDQMPVAREGAGEFMRRAIRG